MTAKAHATTIAYIRARGANYEAETFGAKPIKRFKVRQKPKRRKL